MNLVIENMRHQGKASSRMDLLIIIEMEEKIKVKPLSSGLKEAHLGAFGMRMLQQILTVILGRFRIHNLYIRKIDRNSFPVYFHFTRKETTLWNH